MVFHKGDHADNYSHWLIDKWELKKNTYSTEKTRIAHGYTLKYFCRFIESSAFDSQWGLGKNKLIKKGFNLINARYIRIYGNSGESKVLACRADARINTGFGDHEHVDISSTDTTLPSDGT